MAARPEQRRSDHQTPVVVVVVMVLLVLLVKLVPVVFMLVDVVVDVMVCVVVDTTEGVRRSCGKEFKDSCGGQDDDDVMRMMSMVVMIIRGGQYIKRPISMDNISIF